MLAIRLQRTGRHGHAQFRMIVQDSRFSPKSGRVVAYLGNYNPHTKVATVDSEKAASFLANGAQPSDRAARLLQKEGIKLPDWVKLAEPKKREIRHPEKLRKNRPAEEKPAEPAAEPVAEAEEPADKTSADEPTEETETFTEAAAENEESAAAEEPAPPEDKPSEPVKTPEAEAEERKESEETAKTESPA